MRRFSKRLIIWGIGGLIVLGFLIAFMVVRLRFRDRYADFTYRPNELSVHLGCHFWRVPAIFDANDRTTVLVQICSADDLQYQPPMPVFLKADFDMPAKGELVIGISSQITDVNDGGEIEGITVISVQLWSGGRLYGTGKSAIPKFLEFGAMKLGLRDPLISAFHLKTPTSGTKAGGHTFVVRIVSDSHLASDLDQKPFSAIDVQGLFPVGNGVMGNVGNGVSVQQLDKINPPENRTPKADDAKPKP